MVAIKIEQQTVPIELSLAPHREGQSSVKVKDVMPVHSFQMFYNPSALKSNPSTSSVFCKALQMENSHIALLSLHSVRKT